MPYTSNTPQASQQVSQTQSLIRDNFVELSSFGNGYAELSNQSVAPSFSAGNDGLYTRIYATTAANELFVHKQSFAGVVQIPLTSSILSQSTPAANSNGWTYLPSGIIMRWESFTGNGLTTVTLAGGPAAFSAILSIQLTPSSSAVGDDNFSVRLVSIDSTTQFKVYFSSRTSAGAAAGRANALIVGR